MSDRTGQSRYTLGDGIKDAGKLALGGALLAGSTQLRCNDDDAAAMPAIGRPYPDVKARTITTTQPEKGRRP
jgi:hypothetical protein